ncbi:unnamed protein product [Rhizophagus irregularis]|nr:unnamed protein product [Rhizophagus irregularis]
MVLVHKVYTVNKQAKKESSTINRVLQIRVYPNRQQSQILNDADWEERKFARAVVWLGMLLRGTVGVAPVTITDESIDEALTTKEEVYIYIYIKRNAEKQGVVHPLSLRSLKSLSRTMSVTITFSKKSWTLLAIALFMIDNKVHPNHLIQTKTTYLSVSITKCLSLVYL